MWIRKEFYRGPIPRRRRSSSYAVALRPLFHSSSSKTPPPCLHRRSRLVVLSSKRRLKPAVKKLTTPNSTGQSHWLSLSLIYFIDWRMFCQLISSFILKSLIFYLLYEFIWNQLPTQDRDLVHKRSCRVDILIFSSIQVSLSRLWLCLSRLLITNLLVFIVRIRDYGVDCRSVGSKPRLYYSVPASIWRSFMAAVRGFAETTGTCHST